MKVSINFLENKVAKLNEWLSNNPETHDAYSQEKHKRDYYVGKICEMDEYDLDKIEI